jgi:23S rRNA (pseudouridine1915-N3)-methyltransferase
MVADYLLRASRYAPCTLREVSSESKLLADLDKAAGRTRPVLVLADSSGKQLSSNELADELGRHMESGTQLLAFAIGPADGWSAALLARADLVIAFGRITLPHELAAVVAAEQIYRALTIRAGHPYHSGH